MPRDQTHADMQETFHAALWQSGPPAGLAAQPGGEGAQRFAVYRNNVQHGLTRALAARFPVVERLVGAEFFAAMARVFIAASPPRDPVLLRWGGDFGGFLDGFAPLAHLPWIGDVARLEFARGRAYHAADAAPASPEALAICDPEDLRLTLHPSAELFTSRFPAVSIWQMNQPEAARRLLGTGPDHALIGRGPDFAVIVAPLDQGTHAVLAALLAGETLGHAATHADPTDALTLLLRHGLITDTRKDP